MLAARQLNPQILEATLEEFQLYHLQNDSIATEPRTWFNISRKTYEISQFWLNSVRYDQGDMGITTPLLEAIRARQFENVNILLNKGANPNGPPLSVIEDYSAFFLRFRPVIPDSPDRYGDVANRKEFLDRMDLPQLSTLTWEEVEDRFWDGMAPFWCEQDFVPTNFFPHGEAIPAIVEAARSGSTRLVNALIAAGADTTFWKTPQFFVPARSTESSLSVSSPLHAALQARDVRMLGHLLKLGFDPNTMPLANPTRCFTPLMAAAIQHGDFDYQAFDILAQHPNINFELRTPIYSVHILHFATATLNLRMLEHIIQYTPLCNACKTALGHTLLHIACLPANSLEVQRRSQIIFESIHETRDLDTNNDAFASCPEVDFPYNPYETNFANQISVVQFLWTNGLTNIQDKDVHGNTALHYLCGYKRINQELLSWWLPKGGVSNIMNCSVNMYGATPNQLLDEGARARGLGSAGWKPWFSRSTREERIANKQAIWEELLGNEARRPLQVRELVNW